MNYKNKSLFLLCSKISIYITKMSFTYVCFVTLSFGLDFILSSEVITRNENATFQNIDLVEIVKEDLRRNNEDYGETKYDNNLTSATKGNYEITKKDTITIKVKNNEILKSQRRTNVDSEYSYDDKGKSSTREPQLITNATTKANPIKELLRSQPKKKIVMENLAKKLFIDIKKPIMTHTIKPTTNATQILQVNDEKIPKFVKKNKIDKFKKFMAKNKGLLKDFMSSKKEIQSQKTTSNKPLRSNDLLNSVLKQRGINGNGIQNILSSELMDHKLRHLSPDMLDMAPAKGGRIHRMRVKGRLCQRHVLMPEGPKYDSQGKWYLPAHNLVIHHPYNITLPPKFLLPRCCNCCKKSVLGCE